MSYFDGLRGETLGSLSVSAREGDLDQLQELLNSDGGRERWRAADNKGWTALHHAAAGGHVECVKALGEAGERALVDLRTWEGETALVLSCKNLPRTKSVVHSLLKMKANTNLVTNESCSALHWAAVHCDVEVVKWLVRTGARVNHSSVWGETALHLLFKRKGAAKEGQQVAILRYLLKHGARPVVSDENQLTPLMLAASRGLSTCVELLLAEAGDYERGAAMANLRAEDGATALHMAAQAGNLDCALALLGCGADPELAANDGTLPVHLACIASSQAAALLTLLLPATSPALLEQANRPQPLEQMPRLPGHRKILSPFQLAIQWENYDCLEVLAKYLDPCNFPTPLEACFLHKQHCPADRRDSIAVEAGELVTCPDCPASYLSPLGLLLADNLTPECLGALEHLKSCLTPSESSTTTINPLLCLLTASSANPRQDTFHPDKPSGKALAWLAKEGVALKKMEHGPLLLQATVSGLAWAVRLGLVSPRDLVEPSLLASIRNMVGRQTSLEESLLGRPLVAYRLLCTAILATHCGLLSSDWVQNVALIVLDEFRVVMNISNVVAVDLMYSSLRTPCSLQSLARREVVTSLKDNPGRALDSLPVPPLIKDFLLFCDLDVEAMVQQYKDTMDHVSDNGSANILVL